MATTINHTGRFKLERKHYSINTVQDESGLYTFELDLKLEDSQNLGDASVIVEVNSSNILQRFDFGRASELAPPESTLLDKFSATSTPKFTVLIVDQSAHVGRLLASGQTKALAGDEEGGSSLLVLTTWDLGELVWSVRITQGDRPELCLNQKIPDAIQLLRTKPEYQAMILPAAFREVMTTYFTLDNREEEDKYQELWWKLAESLGGELPKEASLDEFTDWLDSVIIEFSREHNFCRDFVQGLEDVDS